MAEEERGAGAQNAEHGVVEQKPAAPKRVRRAAPTQSADAKKDIFMSGSALLFNKYSYDVEVFDPSLRNYVNLKPVIYPNSYGRRSQNQYHKANINIIERLENSLMRGGTGGKVGGRVIRTKGRLQGKKVKVIKTVQDAFEMINKQTNMNPIQVFVMALENSAPIEDTTRVRYGGIISNVAVDVSASRRLDIALRNLAMATVTSAFHSKKTLADALASELILASRNDINSYAIKRKNETERMARSAK
ncbi:MAG TPA: 30S ribosomal protein S7 [Candidatus Acidoferrum sp.]|nr:30S ribosomal protein S7 [Candidatus Acidoferrum sp.]